MDSPNVTYNGQPECGVALDHGPLTQALRVQNREKIMSMLPPEGAKYLSITGHESV